MSGIPNHLVNAVRNGLVVPFAGAGVAMALRNARGEHIVPSWSGLLSAAVERMESEQRSTQAGLLRIWLEADPTFADPFRFAQQELGSLFSDFLRDKLDPPA